MGEENGLAHNTDKANTGSKIFPTRGGRMSLRSYVSTHQSADALSGRRRGHRPTSHSRTELLDIQPRASHVSVRRWELEEEVLGYRTSDSPYVVSWRMEVLVAHVGCTVRRMAPRGPRASDFPYVGFTVRRIPYAVAYRLRFGSIVDRIMFFCCICNFVN